MIHFDLPKEKSSIIKVIGVGGGGGNAVNFMFNQGIEGVNFIICNTDAQALANSHIPNRVQLGPHLTQGLGAGANPEIGRQATEESLEEIKRILEVNTKMAFITVGMGGGTGTGGAPIIAKICKDLGILTVGIVTTPFTYEGKKRQQQAEEGIKTMKQYVDTILIISNDKLRHQFGNLKMREAFAKADNVLATAAKCITDVINSTGQINVDFADVCTVMRNGGVAILGSASASGENRAQRAIEEALNSPLLNDNEIQGAKWILININSAEGENEFTMDEVEVIQNYLLSQTGENTDVILGLGYDNSLGDQLGITLIATGFQHKDPFDKKNFKKEKKEDKIIMILGQKEEEKMKEPAREETAVTAKQEQKENLLAPKLVEEDPVFETPMPTMNDMIIAEEKSPVIHWELGQENSKPAGKIVESSGATTVNKLWMEKKEEQVNSPVQPPSVSPFEKQEEKVMAKDNAAPLSAASGGYLARPSNIYAETKAEVSTSKPSAEEPVSSQNAKPEEEELLDLQMQIVERDDIPAADMPLAYQAHPDNDREPLFPDVEDPALRDEAEEQKRRAAERLQKLRNLSFNVNAADPNNEFETVPAYIRRNMELYTNSSAAENFYSNYEVKTDSNNQSQISTINTFLDGKKPD
ncbi:MAG: cell division protein FtsZ [Chitinophagaceae bacterium]|jgi:cell division protein FtsZ|nr:cell division protein FtsZ [Chitinophagaceae bacterium]OQY94721.1 MAG: cell division protein FtsZ [Sphingobacteriales bacterium UTBCD1]